MSQTASRAAARILSALFLAAAAAGFARAQAPVGPEFQVNSHTTGEQANPGVAIADDGSFVVVWTSPDGSLDGVFARRYDAAGLPVGPEFAVNAYTTGVQVTPAVASAANGDFVVAWASDQAGSATDVFARRFDAAGAPLGSEFRVHDHTTGAQLLPALAASGDGSFVVAWGGTGATDLIGVFGRRFDATGAPIGTDFAVNAMTTGGQGRPAIALGPGGAFVVAFESLSPSSGIDVVARGFDALGAPLAGDYFINTYTTGHQWFPSVTPWRDGFVVVWQSDSQDGSGTGVYGRYTASSPSGPEFRLNTHTTGSQLYARVAGDVSGDLFAAWTDEADDGSSLGIVGVDAVGGGPFGPALVLNSYTTGVQQIPAVARNADGDIVVAWNSSSQDGSAGGVFAQRLRRESIFRDGFRSGDLSAWSASATGGGDVTVTAGAGLNGTAHGLQVSVDELAARYVQDDSPDDEDRYRARFYFDTNGFDPGEAWGHRRLRLLLVFEENPARRICAVVLRRINGGFSLAGRARRDDNSQQNTGFFSISDGGHFVELDWKRATGPDAEDGAFEMWIDGTSVYATTTLDSSISSVDMVRLGALSTKVGSNGSLYLDEFDSKRSGYIGAGPP